MRESGLFLGVEAGEDGAVAAVGLMVKPVGDAGDGGGRGFELLRDFKISLVGGPEGFGDRQPVGDFFELGHGEQVFEKGVEFGWRFEGGESFGEKFV